jgi:hypothetical protein
LTLGGRRVIFQEVNVSTDDLAGEFSTGSSGKYSFHFEGLPSLM